MRRAFTLIELLIVVAIIAILAAIAVPNFLEAQVRSKVARTVSDMRTIATAIEAYAVDFNKPPFDWAPDVTYPYYLHNCLSTPVGYLSNGHLIHDQFAKNRQSGLDNPSGIRERYRYRAFGETYLSGGVPRSPFQIPAWGPSARGNQMAMDVHGAWFLASKGPDASNYPLPVGFADGVNANDWLWLVYDASNGTLSSGEILRSQKAAAVTGYVPNVIYETAP